MSEPVPNPRQVVDEAALRFLGAGSEMRERVRDFDWPATPLGPIGRWPASLKTATGIVLNAVQPMVVGRGAGADL